MPTSVSTPADSGSAASTGASAAPGQPKQPRNPISRRQIETVVSRSVAVFGILFGAQAVPSALGQVGQVQPAWAWTFIIALYGGFLASVVASMIRRGVRAVNTYVALVFLVEMAAWPLAVANPSAIAHDRPWLWLLLTVAAAAAAIAFSTWVATVYLVVVNLAYGLIRILPSGGGKSPESASLDVAYAIILGGAVVLIVTLLRQASSSVDAAQSTALNRYAHAVGQHATELERVQVDSIVHDSVLTTLLSASRATTPEAKALAVSMAKNAMGHLKDAAAVSPDDDTTISMNQLAHRVIGATATMSAPFELRTRTVEIGAIPVQAAEAVYSAAVQAMVNSLQHAGDDPAIVRWLAVRALPNDGIRVEVGDTGAGFDTSVLPTERLGLRVSILERVANAGGLVEIDSAPGRGTTIAISWPHPQSGESPSVEPQAVVNAEGAQR